MQLIGNKDITQCNENCPGEDGWYITQEQSLEGIAIPAYKFLEASLLLDGSIIGFDNFFLVSGYPEAIDFSSEIKKDGWLEITTKDLIDEEIMRSILVSPCDSLILRSDPKIVILFKDNGLGNGFAIKVVDSLYHRGYHHVSIVRSHNFVEHKVEMSSGATMPVFKLVWEDYNR